ncbi:MAG: chorismate synthase [Thermodesulfovibrionales bacterium]|nr:chorismate synthase [Thermodesulfovibrionales bacterium]
MKKIRFLTSGESHGKALIGVLEGIPSGLKITKEDINHELKRRQLGYGRGGRMKIENDKAEIISGVRWGKTLGSPIAILIKNKDWENWKEGMSIESDQEGSIEPVTRPRPGHADLAGALKYNQKDLRNILERSSARETAVRVALGAVAKKFLFHFGIIIGSYVTQIGHIRLDIAKHKYAAFDYQKLFQLADESPVRCPDIETSQLMIKLIDETKQEGDTLGGVFEVIAIGVPAGLGSHIHWDRRIDALLSFAIMGIQAIKGVEIGEGFRMAEKKGSNVMDEIYFDEVEKLFYRKTNNAGGIEGGITNGMPIQIRAIMKPIPTLRKPLNSIDIITKQSFKATYERSDVCAVASASVIAEAVTALTLLDAFLDKFGGDHISETMKNYKSYINYLKEF